MEEQKIKCAKCGKEIPQNAAKETKSGPICPECLSKKKKRNIFAGIGGSLLVVLAGLGITLGTKDAKVDSFGGLGEINDDVTIENVEIKAFDISKSTAVSSPTSVGGAIDNIDLFKSMVSKTVDGLTGDDKSIQLPSIAVLFDFDSSNVSESSKNLLKEFASIYNKTNKEAIVLVDGYTCDIGEDHVNNTLSTYRANAVKQVLISSGIPDTKIQINGHGKAMYGKLGLTDRSSHRRANVSIK